MRASNYCVVSLVTTSISFNWISHGLNRNETQFLPIEGIISHRIISSFRKSSTLLVAFFMPVRGDFSTNHLETY